MKIKIDAGILVRVERPNISILNQVSKYRLNFCRDPGAPACSIGSRITPTLHAGHTKKLLRIV